MSKEAATMPPPEAVAEITTVVARARRGDASAGPRLRELLAEFPCIAEHYGDLAYHTEIAWAALTADTDLYLGECLLLKAASLKAKLGGGSPDEVERLLVERVVLTWMQLNYFASAEARALARGEAAAVAPHRGRRQEQALRSHLLVLSALRSYQKLMAPAAAAGPAALVEGGGAVEGAATRPSEVVTPPALPPAIQDRLAGLFDRPGGDGPGHYSTCGMGGVAEN